MDDTKASFLFGDRSLEGLDLDDEDVRAELLVVRAGLTEGQRAVRLVLANQISGDDPPEVWSTARRLLEQGLAGDEIMDQLALVLAREMYSAIHDESAFDLERYVGGLQQLPLPTHEQLADEIDALFSEDPTTTSEAIHDRVARTFSYSPDDELLTAWVLSIVDVTVESSDEYLMLWPDAIVHRPRLRRDIVLTHRITEEELLDQVLDATTDLAAFYPGDDFRTADGPLEISIATDDELVLWHGPDGWLSRFSAGDTVAVRLSTDDLLSLDALQTAPIPDAEVADAVRAAYDLELSEYVAPLAISELAARVVLDHGDLFTMPQAPLTELCEAAGLITLFGQVAHDPDMFDFSAARSSADRIHDILGREDQIAAAMAVMEMYWEFRDGEVASLTDRRALLPLLQDPEVLDVVARELARPDLSQLDIDPTELAALADDDDDGPDARDPLVDDAAVDGEAFGRLKRQLHDAALRFTESLVEAASKSRDVAVARYVAAMAAEEAGETLVAEQHLHLALQADPAHPLVIDRCGWYAFDRGDATGAVRLWRQVSTPEDNPDLRMAERFAASTAKPIGRNEPCWCGSGRKYKQCHLGKTELPPLPDRVGWLAQKAAAYLDRSAARPTETIVDLAMAMADDPDDYESLRSVFEDPMLVDLVLVEAEHFELFLEDRGPLLPDDEAMLAASWLLVERTVYEVLETRPGQGLTLRDLRTGDEVEVRERTFSRSATVGQLFCGRAVPDGDTQQLVGGQFPVRPGKERALLELLDEGEADEIAAWVGGSFRAPQMQTREGETIVLCTARVETGDAGAAKAFLDEHYEVDGPQWVELYQLNEREHIRRAGLELDGSTIVVDAQSEPRMDRVIATIVDAFPEAKVVLDERTPADMESFATLAERGSGIRGSGEAPIDGALLRDGLRQFQEQMEEQWCDESIPALDGRTPREAAADPTRRPDLERLLASFPEPPEDADYVSSRPSRLRELLGLDD